MELNKNYETFSKNYKSPQTITINGEEYTKYPVLFGNLYEIHKLLNSNPDLNRRIFRTLSSEKNDEDFAGRPLKYAIEDLIDLKEENFIKFVDIIRDLKCTRNAPRNEYEVIHTLAGGHLSTPLYSVGAPKCYESYEITKKPKFITVHATLSYPWYTTKKQVLNRAIILVSIIGALEKSGYNVNLNTFELSEEGNELIYISVNAKQFGQGVSLQTLYKTSCHVEFLRRILFRVLETLPVKNYWGDGYGSTCSKSKVRKVLNIGPDDIYFDQPSELSIQGNSLEDDFRNCLASLNLESNFNVQQITDDFNERARKLIRK